MVWLSTFSFDEPIYKRYNNNNSYYNYKIGFYIDLFKRNV